MKFLLLSIVILTAFCACEDCSTKQVTCPAFSDTSFANWFPYVDKQKLIFSSGGVKDTFTLTNSDFSKIYQTTISGNNPGCNAYARLSFSPTDSLGNSSFDIYANRQQDQYSNNKILSSQIFLKNRRFYGNLTDSGMQPRVYEQNLYSSHFYSSYTIGTTTYQNLQEYYIDTTKTVLKSNEIYKIWIAKGTGLAAYEEYHGKLWVKL